MKRKESNERRGIIIPLIAVGVVALIGLVALAVDIGRLAWRNRLARLRRMLPPLLARGVWMGRRTCRGNGGGDGCGDVLRDSGDGVKASEVAVSHGSYHYDASGQKFTPQIPAVAPDNFNLTKVIVTHSVSTTFARVLGRRR